jgi:5-methylcytosine-specific restriction endonuclease McrA
VGSFRSQHYDALVRRDGERCRHCGGTHELTVDHVIPKALGGTNSRTNLQLLCRECNQAKGATLNHPDGLTHAQRRRRNRQLRRTLKVGGPDSHHLPGCDVDFCMAGCPVAMAMKA